MGCVSPRCLLRREQLQILRIYRDLAEHPQTEEKLNTHQRKRACGDYCLTLNSYASHKDLLLSFEV